MFNSRLLPAQSDDECLNAPIAYSVAEAVRVTGLGRTTLYGMMSQGRLPFRKVGNRTLLLRRDLLGILG